ncbi:MULTISPECIES: BTAD domain-containing putative transcriptional regulator [unclassified Micromonospora]|uniref:AfsR/SARP family transcriptional regulator n=1 Tax=unclassified Micromonospora TaxID=2617518 RepID=UPI0015E7EE28|nr:MULTISPECIES: BTAD domain-containing putative transcriptional regulator [unclassified Micromonospora]MCK1809066.1 NB-ARC domain-containing protein [Micromonospora sp. R42106]MCK1834731.1 NB-ARC domain-containing protein [Micromonospora sp. R42003]MCK1846643.1 NB-ARC domain-containing protein [Micromonospora sp. R42004]MCM1019522.1 NB-ARC domain-containing protein [Micromonospora sp. XM-20-01]
MFRLLGPVEVCLDDRTVRVGGPRSQAMLAALLLEANRIVPVSRLMDAAWGGHPPASADVQVRNRVAAARRALRAAGLPGDVIGTHGSGYLLTVAEGQLDLDVFEERVRRAEGLLDRGGAPEEAVSGLREALAMWRGPALDGLRTPALTAAAQRLDERRMTVVERCLGLELGLGRYDSVIGRLTELVEAYPWRESLVGQLMRALYLADRQGEALDRFDQLRRRLAEELGIDPTAQLIRLRDLILRNDPSLRSAPDAGPAVAPSDHPPAAAQHGVAAQHGAAGPDGAARPPVRMLPAGLTDFVGREEQIAAVLEWLPERPAVAVTAISGLPGVGKTTLAVRIAHQLGPAYPGPHLYVDLNGHDHPAPPVEVLGRFLRALGVPGAQIPADLEERAALFRGAMAERPGVVLLDNAADAAQVRPLLPGTDTVVLVTSRRALVDVDGAHQLRLEPLPEADALRLLAGIIGPDRVAAEPGSASDVVHHCGLLPLAVRIAGARLAIPGVLSLRQAAAQLAELSHRLDHLARADRSVRAAFHSAYVALDEPARRLLRRFAVLDLDRAPPWLPAVLLDDEAGAANAVTGLVEANLVEVTGPDELGQVRYHLHDLVRAFARERAAREEGPRERPEVLRRVFGTWLTLTEQARVALSQEGGAVIVADLPRSPAPTGEHLHDPKRWFGAERAALLAGIEQAAATPGLEDYSWALAWHCDYYLFVDARVDDLTRVTEIGLAAAERRRHPEGIARLRLCVAFAALLRSDLEAALGYARAAAAAAEPLAQPWLRADIAGVENQVYEGLGDRPAARASLVRSIELYQEAGDEVAAGPKLARLGVLQFQEGDPAAGETLARAVALLRAAGTPRPLAFGLRASGRWHDHRGAVDEARAAYLEALELVRRHGDRLGEVALLSEVAAMLAGHGRLGEAAGYADTALEQAREMRVAAYLAYARYAQGRISLMSGDPARARVLLEQAADDLTASPPLQLEALMDLARAVERLTGAKAARDVWRRAHEVAARIGATATADEIERRLAGP